MKNLTRSSLTAVALAALIGITGCGVSQPIVSATDQASEQAQTETSTKPANWSDKFDASKAFPAEWNEGAGWSASIDAKTLISFGDYLAYVDQNENKVVVVDGKGEKKFVSGASEEFEGSVVNTAGVVHKDGKEYLVVSETGVGKADATSVKKSGQKSLVHLFDTEMKEVWKKSYPNSVTARNDAIVVNAPAGQPTQSVVNILSGEIEVLTPPAGYNWAGNFNGTNVYSLIAATTNGELTNGVWKYKAGKTLGLNSETTSIPSAFGKVISVERSTAKGGECDLLDPATGTPLELGAANGSCIKEVFTSPDGNYVFFDGEGNTKDGVISLSGKRIFSISDDISFVPTSVNNDGVIYGKSGNDVAVFDFNKDTEPKKIPGVKQSPVLVAKNGIAVFASGDFVVKK